MKKCNIFFFSGTGNTYFVSKKIADVLNEKGWDAICLPIDSMTKAEIEWEAKSSDLIGIGYPVYASSVPNPISQFLEILPEVKKQKDLFVFCTRSGTCKDGAHIIASNLSVKGYNIVGVSHFKMPNNIPFAPFCKNRECDDIETLVSEFAVSLLETPKIENSDSGAKLKFRTGKYRNIIKKCSGSFKVNSEKCNACMLCARFCPTSNITIEQSKVSFGKNCAACMRCLNFCEKDAITFLRKPLCKYPGPYLKFTPADIYKKR